MGQQIFCSCCGAEGQAGCECGAEYIPAPSARAAMAIARNPEKSNRAIAAEIGVSDMTVGRVRRETGATFVAPEKRIGRDGKMQAAKKKGVTRPAKPDEIGEDGFKAGRRIDTRTGENISRVEAIKRDAAAEFEAKLAEKDEEILELKKELLRRPKPDDVRLADATERHVHRITTEVQVYNLLRRCLHPDSRKSVSDEMLHAAWAAFNKLQPITYDITKCAPPLPTIDELWARRQAKGK